MLQQPFKLTVATDHSINMCLVRTQTASNKSYSIFIRTEEAEFFANKMEEVLKVAQYTDRSYCRCCGKPLTKKDELYKSDTGEYLHINCHKKLRRNGQIRNIHEYEYVGASPLYVESNGNEDFTNLGGGGKRLTFSITAVSPQTILLCIDDGPYCCYRKNFCYTEQECRQLVEGLRRKIRAIQDSQLGICHGCGEPVYLDERRYLLSSGEMVHAVCMEDFICSDKAVDVQFPAKPVEAKNVFGRMFFYEERQVSHKYTDF